MAMQNEIKISAATRAYIGEPLYEFLSALPDTIRPHFILSPLDTDKDNLGTFETLAKEAGFTQDGNAETYGSISALRADLKGDGTPSPAQAYPAHHTIRIAKIDDPISLLEQTAKVPKGTLNPDQVGLPAKDLEAFAIFHECIHMKHNKGGPTEEFEGDLGGRALYETAYMQGVVQTPPAKFFNIWTQVRALAAPTTLSGQDKTHYMTSLVETVRGHHYMTALVSSQNGGPDEDTLLTWENEFASADEAICLAAGNKVGLDASTRFKAFFNHDIFSTEQISIYEELEKDPSLTNEEKIALFKARAAPTEEQLQKAEDSLAEDLREKGNLAFDATPELRYELVRSMMDAGEFDQMPQAKIVLQQFLDAAKSLAPDTFIGKENPAPASAAKSVPTEATPSLSL